MQTKVTVKKIKSKSFTESESYKKLRTNMQFSGKDIKAIASLMLSSLKERLLQNGITATFDDSALEKIAEEGFDVTYGARPLRRAISSKIEDMLANEMLEGKVTSGDTINIVYKDDTWSVEKQ